MPRFLLGFLTGLLFLGCGEPPAGEATAPPMVAAVQAAPDVEEDTVAREEPLTAPAPAPPPPAAPKKVTVAPPPPTNTAPAPAPPKAKTVAVSSFAPSHAIWNELLQRHVSAGGKVDYRGLLEHRDRLETYLDLLAKDAPDARWTREERLAYWINAYNAFTIQLILNNWPVKSIRDLDEPWDRKFIKLEGKAYSLNQIEHEIIRPEFREPRIHFALVCAALSCPPLANQAYTPANLERMLEERTRSFINDEKFNVTQEAVVRVSPLFDWYADDFGDPKTFLNRYLVIDIPPRKELHFLDYDWELND